MNFFLSALIFALVTFAIGSCRLTSEEEDEFFKNFTKQHGIRLGRSNVERSKKQLIDRYYQIEEHNKKFQKGETSYKLALDEWSLLSNDEFIKQRTGLLPSNRTENPGNFLPVKADTKTRSGRASAPASWDWRTVPGVVRSVQNQGSCGSCWAFAAVGSLEGQLSRLKNRHEKLSEQEVIECARNPWDNSLLGCNGGWDFSVYDHARAKNGITYQSNRPYRGYAGYGCNTGTPRVSGSKPAAVTYYKLSAGNEAQMKEILYNVGPLFVTYYVSNDFNNYRSGVYTDSRRYCGNYYNNHGVLLVGYGNQGGIDYWLVKNSWGPNWGESGYFKIQRGKNLCGISKDVSYPRLE